MTPASWPDPDIHLGRTAQLKKTSEERCREAFATWYQRLEGHTIPNAWKDPGVGAHEAMALGWEACWHHLEKQVVKEFIEG